MNYETYHYFGMHTFWWIIWVFFLIWVFATPYNIPGQRAKHNSPLDILKKRYALREINKEEYREKKTVLKS